MDRLGFIEKELNFERQKGTQPTTFTGLYRGYYVVFEINEAGGESANKFLIKIGATIEHDEDWFIDLRNEIGANYNAFLERQRHVVTILGKLPQKNKEVSEYVEGLMNHILDPLIKYDIQTGDFISGTQTGKIELYQINKHYNFLTAESFENYLERQEKKNINHTPEEEHSIQAGIGSAIVVSIIGALIWGVFIYFNWYSWLAALFVIHVAFIFYRRNNGKANILGTFLVALTAILALLMVNTALSFLFTQTHMTLFSTRLLTSIGVIGVYTLIYAYGLYNAHKEKSAARKV